MHRHWSYPSEDAISASPATISQANWICNCLCAHTHAVIIKSRPNHVGVFFFSQRYIPLLEPGVQCNLPHSSRPAPQYRRQSAEARYQRHRAQYRCISIFLSLIAAEKSDHALRAASSCCRIVQALLFPRMSFQGIIRIARIFSDIKCYPLTFLFHSHDSLKAFPFAAVRL